MKEFAPYIVPLLVLALIVRRGLRAKPSKVRLRSMWFMPVVIALATASLLGSTPMPSMLALAGFVGAFAGGLGAGWLRARHMAFSVDPEKGTLTSTATPIGTMLVAVLFVVRFALKLMFPELNAAPHGHPGATAVLWTDAGLLFSMGLVWGRVVTTWIRARPLLTAHHAAKAGGTE